MHDDDTPAVTRGPNRAQRRAVQFGGRMPRTTTRAQRVTLRQNQDSPARVQRARRIRERRAAARLEQRAS